jgi:quercetin dioxygenase-like cupin family protein
MTDDTSVELPGFQQFTDVTELEGVRIGAGASIILVDLAPGGSVRLHRHAYREIFIVQEGQATYTVGTEVLEVEAPRVIAVSPGVPHAFVNSGTGRLRQVDIHDSPRIVTEWLQSTSAQA